MAIITITDIDSSMMCKVIVQIDENRTEEYYLPKQLVDLITQANSNGIVERDEPTKTIDATEVK